MKLLVEPGAPRLGQETQLLPKLSSGLPSLSRDTAGGKCLKLPNILAVASPIAAYGSYYTVRIAASRLLLIAVSDTAAIPTCDTSSSFLRPPSFHRPPDLRSERALLAAASENTLPAALPPPEDLVSVCPPCVPLARRGITPISSGFHVPATPLGASADAHSTANEKLAISPVAVARQRFGSEFGQSWFALKGRIRRSMGLDRTFFLSSHPSFLASERSTRKSFLRIG